MNPLIYAATSPHTDVFYLVILTTVTLESTNNTLPDDGVTAAPKHVGAVPMSILKRSLKFVLRQFTCASVGELKINFDLSGKFSFY